MRNFDRFPTGSSEREWTPAKVVDEPSAPAAAEPVPWESGEIDGLSNWLPHQDRTRVFLHQLSQALTSLHGILELALLVDSGEEKYRRTIQESLVQAEGLVELFKSYRALAEVETTDPLREPVGLDALVREALELLRPLLDSRRITVHIDSADDCFVQTYPLRLLLALRRGLLRSIQESSPGGKLEVCISTKEGSACVTISAVRQRAEARSQPALAEIPEDESAKALASDNAEGDWTLVRRDVEALGGSVLTTTADTSHLFCKICLPPSRPEGS